MTLTTIAIEYIHQWGLVASIVSHSLNRFSLMDRHDIDSIQHFAHSFRHGMVSLKLYFIV